MAEEAASVGSSDGEGSVGCTPRCDAACCREYCCSWNKYWKALVWLIVVIVYLGFGGLIFVLAESPNEQRMIREAQMERQMAQQALNQSRDTFVERIVNVSNLTYEEAGNLTDSIVALATRLANATQRLPAETNPIWEYGPAVFFASTVITTIGYGTIAPTTSAGRVLFVFYALVGIPIALIFLSTLGDIFSSWIERALTPVKNRCGGNKAILGRSIAILFIIILGLVLFIFFPALVFAAIEEDWTYGEAVYFCFVSLTTVGFGDFVPARSSETFGTTLLGLYKICVGAWTWLGLAFVALLITEIQNIIEAGGKALKSCHCLHKKQKSDDLERELSKSPGGEEGGEGNKQGREKQKMEVVVEWKKSDDLEHELQEISKSSGGEERDKQGGEKQEVVECRDEDI